MEDVEGLDKSFVQERDHIEVVGGENKKDVKTVDVNNFYPL